MITTHTRPNVLYMWPVNTQRYKEKYMLHKIITSWFSGSWTCDRYYESIHNTCVLSNKFRYVWQTLIWFLRHHFDVKLLEIRSSFKTESARNETKYIRSYSVSGMKRKKFLSLYVSRFSALGIIIFFFRFKSGLCWGIVIFFSGAPVCILLSFLFFLSPPPPRLYTPRFVYISPYQVCYFLS